MLHVFVLLFLEVVQLILGEDDAEVLHFSAVILASLLYDLISFGLDLHLLILLVPAKFVLLNCKLLLILLNLFDVILNSMPITLFFESWLVDFVVVVIAGGRLLLHRVFFCFFGFRPGFSGR